MIYYQSKERNEGRGESAKVSLLEVVIFSSKVTHSYKLYTLNSLSKHCKCSPISKYYMFEAVIKLSSNSELE